ncbi:CoA-disulfide reductase [Oceanobacillus neutriphilus]|uniref:NADH dehydrogenase n=1 Tax=Oceanobacillus neutriphilus TaxID=531815 RepID=A0ABQ2P2D0_9BACI|nr:CoA-disulfide reductase [Oceanobacillus neutriphilus]GGP16573.1 NADH dehydrogenase [Oceanobacillus neutriphilus]
MVNKIVIIGGVGGGATVAAQIRRTDPDSEIHILDRCGYISFANCGMPYYLGGEITERDRVIYSENDFAEKYNVSIETYAEVTHIEKEKKTVFFEKNNKPYEMDYDTLILSPGARAIMPDLQGIQSNTFTLRTIEDMDRIEAFISEKQPKTAAVIGGGFVGLEMVENLHKRGLQCSLIDHSEHVMKRLDPDMASHVDEHLMENGVELYLNDKLKSYSNHGTTLHLQSGKTIKADMTLMAVGITPNVELAKDAGLELGETGAIKVNKVMQTNDPSIYALGDAVEEVDFITKKPAHVALAWPAHRQAFVIASHLNGETIQRDGILGSSLFRVFDLTVAITGQNSQSLNELNIPFNAVTSKGFSHAGYYPGSEKLWMKIVYDPKSGQLLGGSVIGKKGADKRMAVLATAIKGKLTVDDLTDLELGYNPIYSSSKDAINILGYKAREQWKKANS